MSECEPRAFRLWDDICADGPILGPLSINSFHTTIPWTDITQQMYTQGRVESALMLTIECGTLHTWSLAH